MKAISIAILGTGPLADLIAKRIEARKDLHLAGVVVSTEKPPSDSACVIYLPSATEQEAGSSAARITELLRAGFNVVSTLPAEALPRADILAACKEGKSSFHGSGGFQSSLISRFNRAFASITRNIRDVELIEERDVEDGGLPTSDKAQSAEAGAYYEAGLNLLSEAVFGEGKVGGDITRSALRTQAPASARLSPHKTPAAEQLCVCRTLGEHVSYDSVWTQRTGNSAPLRYRFNTRSSDALGYVSIDFHAGNGASPTDHLAASGLLDAVHAVQESAPGILRHDLDIWQVKADDRFQR
ncbi:MAG: hypothetical protein ACRERR_07780 [Moraxellaceae bacterium]